MAFISTNRNERDRIGLGSHAYGGLQFSSSDCSLPNVSPRKRFIAEHNLARYWGTPFLEPHEVGFSHPMLRMSDLSHESANLLRPPGAYRADQPTARLKRRNLLAGATHVTRENSRIPLWLVDESTDRKQIFNLNIGYEIGEEGKPSMVMDNCCVTAQCQASADVVQLRCFKGCADQVAVRTMKSLELCGPSLEHPHTLFHQFVEDVLQIPYMEDEIVLSDRMGLVWHGKIGQPLGRVKHLENITKICSTDCPRVILAGDSFRLHFRDFREHPMAHSHGNVLFELDDFFPDVHHIKDPLDTLRNPMTICHVSPIPGQPNYTMLTTERFHYVLDQRTPKKPILAMSHSCYAGGDFVTFGAMYIDRSRATDFGRPPVVLPYYTMNLAVKPAVQLWSLYFHPNINVFSSLGPPKNVQSLDDALKYVKYHGDGRIPNKPRMGTQAISMHHCAVGDEDAFLFRLSDNGVLWSDAVTIKDRSVDKMADAEVALEFFEDEEPPIYERGVNAEFLRAPSTAITLMDCELELADEEEDDSYVSELFDRQVLTGVPFDMTKREAVWPVEKSEIVNDVDEDRVFSGIVVKMWNKMEYIVTRDDKEIVQKNGELYVNEPEKVDEEGALDKLFENV
ncbi:hypothetical protein QR680_006983 [Steinernema hermaphroditum]|uniref:Uncharacterized protein n=1 Tax=Steinernema hermaphroditum TaxID=289476 RepID=A0AA39HZK5_9BILA|nr:hypothetical protein QR680_006983 [Steinernema hermaphroditum]